MTITHRERAQHANADGSSRNTLEYNAENPASDLREDVMQIFGLHIVDLLEEFFHTIGSGYKEDKNFSKIMQIMQNQSSDSKELAATLEKPFKEMLEEGQFMLNRDILYVSNEGVFLLVIGDRPSKREFLKMAHNSIIAGHLNVERSTAKVQKTALWNNWEKDVENWVETYDVFQRADRKTGKRFGLLKQIEDLSYP